MRKIKREKNFLNYFGLLASLLLLGLGVRVLAEEPVNTLEKSGFLGYEHSGVAIRGADTVAYFTEKKYVAGSDAYTTEWNGATVGPFPLKLHPTTKTDIGAGILLASRSEREFMAIQS